MSSILRALKKLEEEGATKESRQGWPQGVGPYVQVERQGGFRRRWYMLGLLLAVVVFAGGSWLLIGDGLVVSDVVVHKEIVSVSPLPEESPTVISPSAPIVSLPTEKVAVVPQEKEELSPAVALSTSGRQDDLDQVGVEVEEAPLAPDSLTPPLVEKEPAIAADVLLPVLSSPDLDLQAVAWSAAPAQRVAVIGNRVVKEGDFVLGYMVLRINQDDIVVRKQGVSSRILFNGR